MKTILKEVTGTGASLDIELGFTPEFVKITNVVTRTALEYNSKDTSNALGIAIAAAGTRTSAAAGVTALETDKDTSKGIVLAAAATVNVNTNLLLVEAGFYQG